MALFQDSKKEAAFLKLSLLGFPGTGKTFTAVLIMLGLHEYLKSDKPVFFLDTETGSDYIKKYFDRAGVNLKTAKTRAFTDLLAAVDEAEQNGGLLIIDSITHFWAELVDAYKKRKNKRRLSIGDWGEIKPEWAVFTQKYLNSRAHIAMLGRAGWEFDETVDDEGAKGITKTGTKMKVETDLGYEPSLALEMEKLRTNPGHQGGTFNHRCWVLKDRFNLINGQFKDFPATKDADLDLTAANPVFQFLLPHIESLNLGGEHRAVDATRNSVEMFNTDRSAADFIKRREIALEEFEDEMKLAYPGADSASKTKRIEVLKDLFGTSSWTAIQGMQVEKIQEATKMVKTGLVIGAHKNGGEPQ